jgi:hypothetical protein
MSLSIGFAAIFLCIRMPKIGERHEKCFACRSEKFTAMISDDGRYEAGVMTLKTQR